MLQYLVEQDTDKDKASNDGRTALMAAARRGHFRVVAFSLEDGVDLTKVTTNDGQTSLHFVPKSSPFCGPTVHP